MSLDICQSLIKSVKKPNPKIVKRKLFSSRTFHRTTSALMTLEDANAILAEFDRASPTCEEHASPPCDDIMDTGNGSLPHVNNEDDDMPDLHQMVTSTDISTDSKDN